MKKLLLSLSLILSGLTSLNAQSEADIWYFGQYAGLDFTGGAPVILNNGAMDANEGSASICDGTGALLFYTDGMSIWNKNHVTMPNGTGLLGGNSTTQPAMIVPDPGDVRYYYVFTMDDYGGSDGLRYSKVDITLDGGNGDVTATKNILLDSGLTEKIAAVREIGGSNYWIVVHKWGSNAFKAFKLTAAGIDPPVTSNVGMTIPTGMIQYTYGQMKFSACGDHLALANGYRDTIEIFDFNTVTGQVYNPVPIPVADHVYGIEFSPSGDLLYASTYYSGGTLMQYDITSGIPAVIETSGFALSYTPDIYGIQLGPDGKIYVCKSFSPYLGVINFPDLNSIAADYQDMAINLDTGFTGLYTAKLSLPSFMQSYLNFTKTCILGTEEEMQALVNPVYPNPSGTEFLYTSTEVAQLIVYDQFGKLIESRMMGSGETISFGKAYPPGIYMLLENIKGSTQSQRLVRY